MAPRDRVIRLWSQTQPPALQPKIDAAMRAQAERMAQYG